MEMGSLTDYSAGDYELDEEAEVWGVTNSDEFNYTYNEFNQLIKLHRKRYHRSIYIQCKRTQKFKDG